MFTSFDETAFWKAISEKDKLHLKVNTVSAMRNDPTFERGETAKVISILEKEIPEIFEPEVTLEYEERLERGAWDKGYFTKLTYWFQENFAKSRIDHIKEVGQVVHKDTAKKYAESMSMKKPTTDTVAHKTTASIPPTQKQNPTKAPETRKVFPLAGAIAAVVALVLLVVLLIKALTK